MTTAAVSSYERTHRSVRIVPVPVLWSMLGEAIIGVCCWGVLQVPAVATNIVLHSVASGGIVGTLGALITEVGVALFLGRKMQLSYDGMVIAHANLERPDVVRLPWSP